MRGVCAAVLCVIVASAVPECAFDPPRQDDKGHPCIAPECAEDKFGDACRAVVVRYCFETGRLSSENACLTYTASCSSLFTAPPPIESTRREFVSTGNNSTRNSTRTGVWREIRESKPAKWICSADQPCSKDVFSGHCARVMVDGCTDGGGLNVTDPGCAIVRDMCPFPPTSDEGYWVCHEPACLANMRSHDCEKLMANVCLTQDSTDRSAFCTALLPRHAPLKTVGAEGEEDVDAMLQWVDEQAKPDPAAQYNEALMEKARQRRERERAAALAAARNAAKEPLPPPPLYPSRA